MQAHFASGTDIHSRAELGGFEAFQSLTSSEQLAPVSTLGPGGLRRTNEENIDRFPNELPNHPRLELLRARQAGSGGFAA